MVLRLAIVVCAGLALASCVRSTPVRRLEQPAAIAVAFVHDLGARVESVPPELSDAVVATLAERGLQTRPVNTSGLAAELASRRETRHRLELAAAASDAPYILLVELRAEFYSQISGRFRWTVYVKLSLALRDGLADVSTRSFDLPVVLELERERENAALSESARGVAVELGRLVDDFLAGQGAPLR